MVRVDQQAQIQQLCLLVGELLVRPVGGKNVLGGALPRRGRMEEHALLVVYPALELVGVHHDGGQPGDQVDGLLHQVFQAQVLGALVVAVEREHAAGHLIHNVGTGRAQQHVLDEMLGQIVVLGDDLLEFFQLALFRQAAEQKQPADLLEDEAVVLVGLPHQLVQVHAPVDQAARGGNNLARRALFVAHNITDVGQARQHAGAVRVAQAPLDSQPFTGLGINVVIFQIFPA